MAVAEASSLPPGLTLVQRWSAQTWLARSTNGALVVVQRVWAPPGASGDGQALSERATQLVGTRLPPLVPLRGVVKRGNAFWLLSEFDSGVSLDRLLLRAKLSLTQATALATLLLEAVAAMHAAGYAHGSLEAGNVHIGPRGEVRLADWGPTALFPAGSKEKLRRADVAAVAAIVARLARAAGKPAGRADEQAGRILAALESASSPKRLAHRGLMRMAGTLETSLGGGEGWNTARNGLAGLITALARRPQAAPHEPIVESFPAPEPEETPGQDRLSPVLAVAWSRLWKAAAVFAVLAAVVGIELVFFGDQVNRNVNVLLAKQPGSGEAQAGGAPGPRRPGPLPVLGPPTEGPITGVEIRPLDGCRPGAVCTVLVQLGLHPQPGPLPVAWRFEIVDRCRSSRESRPGGAVSVPPGRDRVVQTNALTLPPGRSLAVIAVTSEPVSVAGRPMRLPDDEGPC
jgi:hypothetical protein